MGGWDINCAFCGAPFHIFNAFGEEDDFEEGASYNPDLINDQGEFTLENWKYGAKFNKALRSGMARKSSSHWI